METFGKKRCGGERIREMGCFKFKGEGKEKSKRKEKRVGFMGFWAVRLC